MKLFDTTFNPKPLEKGLLTLNKLKIQKNSYLR
jgi:hypothetical protein